MGKLHNFKMAFVKTASSGASNKARRLAKVDAALGQLQNVINGNPVFGAAGGVFQNRYNAILASRNAANAMNDKAAFEALAAVKTAAKLWLKDANYAVAAQGARQVATNDANARVFASDIPGFPANGPLSPHDNAIAQQVDQKVTAGHQVYHAIAGGNMNNPPTKQQVADLMWFLKARAQNQLGQPFDKGAMTIEDPGNRIANVLMQTQGAYDRASSHLKGQQKRPQGGAVGIDYYEGVNDDMDQVADVNRLLPTGMRTLLVQKVKTADGGDRLYLKMETEGCDWKGGHLQQTIRHGVNLFSERQQEFKGRREQIPDDVKQDFTALADELKSAIDQLGPPQQALRNAAKHVQDSFGAAKATLGAKEYNLGLIADALEELSDLMQTFAPLPPAWTATNAALQRCCAVLDDHFGGHDDQALGARFGQEVVVDTANLA